MEQYGSQIPALIRMNVKPEQALETAKRLQRPTRNANEEKEKSKQRLAILEGKLKSHK